MIDFLPFNSDRTHLSSMILSTCFISSIAFSVVLAKKVNLCLNPKVQVEFVLNRPLSSKHGKGKKYGYNKNKS